MWVHELCKGSFYNVSTKLTTLLSKKFGAYVFETMVITVVLLHSVCRFIPSRVSPCFARKCLFGSPRNPPTKKDKYVIVSLQLIIDRSADLSVILKLPHCLPGLAVAGVGMMYACHLHCLASGGLA